MSRPDIRQQLLAVVEQHGSQMTPDAEATMERLLDQAAKRLASKPDRTDEAVTNLQRLLDHAAETSAAVEGGGDVMTVGRAVDADSLRIALRDLCPFFPFC